MSKYPHVPCAHGVDVNDECQGCKDVILDFTNMDFIKQQQELARKKIKQAQSLVFNDKLLEPQKYLDEQIDIAITQVITNTGEELLRLAEGERKKKNSIKHFSGNGYYNQQGHNQAIDTLKKHITNLMGVEKV